MPALLRSSVGVDRDAKRLGRSMRGSTCAPAMIMRERHRRRRLGRDLDALRIVEIFR